MFVFWSLVLERPGTSVCGNDHCIRLVGEPANEGHVWLGMAQVKQRANLWRRGWGWSWCAAIAATFVAAEVHAQLSCPGSCIGSSTAALLTVTNRHTGPAASFQSYGGGTLFDRDPQLPPADPAVEVMSLDGEGVSSLSYFSNGVRGESMSMNGVQGVSLERRASGVYGENMSGGGFGIAGRAKEDGIAVYGDNSAATGWAGYFNGRVHVGGYLSKAAGGFTIDHPLDPENKLLTHSFVESPEMKNVYDGVVTLDEQGTAVVEMPPWFSALNRDFRYQLTTLGAFAPVYIARELEGQQFTIAGGTPGLRVSWQVTGVRQDAYALHHPLPVEESKRESDRGRYLQPEAHGKPAALAMTRTLSAAPNIEPMCLPVR